MGLTYERREKLEGQARMLAIGYYIVGGLIMLFSLFFLIYVGIGVAVMAAPIPTQPGEPPPQLMGAFFAGIGGCGMLMMIGLGVANFIAAVNLRRLRGRTLILIVGILNLMHQPLGLILGIFTIIFIAQADAKELFDEVEADEVLV